MEAGTRRKRRNGQAKTGAGKVEIQRHHDKVASRDATSGAFSSVLRAGVEGLTKELRPTLRQKVQQLSRALD